MLGLCIGSKLRFMSGLIRFYFSLVCIKSNVSFYDVAKGAFHQCSNRQPENRLDGKSSGFFRFIFKRGKWGGLSLI